LPNTLVDGFGTGDSPLSRLRQIRDNRAIPMLLDCYRLANLAEDGGLPWWTIRTNFKRLKIYTHGHFTVWGFVGDTAHAIWEGPFARFRPLGQDEGSRQAWVVFDALRDAGLIEYVGHIVEGLEEGSQALHSYALPGSGEPEERAVREAADAAGRAMITDKKYEWAQGQLGKLPWLCPVRSHVTNAELVGIVRPVHRAHTRKTLAWAANFLHQCDGHRVLFENLRDTAMKSAA
jgi:hypothetical protein